jgi:hypothetical protein
MASLLRSLRPLRREPSRSITTVDDYADALASFSYGFGGIETLTGLTGTYGKQATERVSHNLEGYAQAAYAANGVVFACMAVRMAVFSTVRFQWQRINGGQPSELFGTPSLSMLETPWTGGTTQDLLARMIQDADLAGNSYWTGIDGELVRLRPDWVQIVLEPRTAGGRQVGWSRLGYAYWEGGIGNSDPAVFLADQVAHFAPSPDPLASYRGMSWLTPVLREVTNDKAMNTHKAKYFENAAPQPLSAPVLTPRGWSTMGAMLVGSEVIGSDGKPHRVTGVYPQGERDIYCVRFADGSAVECTNDHVWSVQSIYDRKRGVLRQLTTAQIAADTHYRSGPAKWAVPFVDPIEFDAAESLPIDPWLLGVLLGDGCMTGPGGPTLAADARDAAATESLLAASVPAGVTVSRRDRGGWVEFYLGSGGRRGNPLKDALGQFGVWGVKGPDKSVPPAFLRASIADRLALLRGLLDSDGSVDQGQPTLVRFSSTSRALADAVRELARSLGGTATLKRTSRGQWAVNVQRLPEAMVPFSLPRKADIYRAPGARGQRARTITSVEFVRREEAQCIRVDVPDHLYVTSDYVLTHNTPNLAVSLDKDVRVEAFKQFQEVMDTKHRGVQNAYRTLYLGGGADVKVIGSDLQQINFSQVQGHGETRVAAAAGVPPVIVGLSEGLQAATYSNYGQARRRFADGTMHPLWQNAAGSLVPVIPPPPSDGRSASRLWYDARDVAFLREDRMDAANIQGRQATTIRTLVDAGYEPDAVVAAVQAEDYTLLKGRHTGLFSVQLQPPGADRDSANTGADNPTEASDA